MNDEKEALGRYERKKARIVAQFREALAGGASIGSGKKTSNLFRTPRKAKCLIGVGDLDREKTGELKHEKFSEPEESRRSSAPAPGRIWISWRGWFSARAHCT